MGRGRLFGFIRGTPEVADGRQAVLLDVPSEVSAVVVDADRDEHHVFSPRLPATLAGAISFSIGSRQGPHHVAQNSRKTTWPRKSANRTG